MYSAVGQGHLTTVADTSCSYALCPVLQETGLACGRWGTPADSPAFTSRLGLPDLCSPSLLSNPHLKASLNGHH